MGVLNATPDSFHAGSRAGGIDDALAKAETMLGEGADVLDIGGESTRPGAEPVPAAVELDRALPVLEAIHQRWPDLPISIDTQKSEVARQALAHGACIVNDISALRHDPEMAAVIAGRGCGVVLMHMQGTPETMQKNPRYDDLMDELRAFFEERLAAAVRQGIAEDAIVLDPGLGFGKTLEHNLTILKNLSKLKVLGRPLLVGISRKSFIGKLMTSPSPGLRPPSPSIGRGKDKIPFSIMREKGSGDEGADSSPEARLEGSIAATLWALREGADAVRVHDVGATRRAIRVWQALSGAAA